MIAKQLFTLASTTLLVLTASSFAATITFDNLSPSGNAAYGVRGASGALATSPGYSGVLGTFTISDSAVSSFFAAGNTASIAAGFSIFDPTNGTFSLDSLASGAFQTSESFSTKASANTFGGSSIYAILYNGASVSAATELFIAKLNTTFPTDPEVGAALLGSASLTPTGIASILAGTTGAAHDYGFGGGSLSTYQLQSVSAVPEASRMMLGLFGMVALGLRRRR